MVNNEKTSPPNIQADQESLSSFARAWNLDLSRDSSGMFMTSHQSAIDLIDKISHEGLQANFHARGRLQQSIVCT